MIYLIRTFRTVLGSTLEEDHAIPVLKIGYTDDNRGNGRLNDYEQSGLIHRVIKTIPGGSIDDEKRLHRVLREFRLPNKNMREWYVESPKIYEFFNECNDLESLLDKVSKLEEKDISLNTLKPGSFADIKKRRQRCIDLYGQDSEQCVVFDSIFENTNYIDRLKYICLNFDQLSDEIKWDVLDLIPEYLSQPYKYLGPSRLKSLSYQKDRISAEYDRLVNNQDINISKIIQESFNVGECYRKPDIKSQLSKIYLDNNYKKTAKASDICNYFNTVDCDVFTEDGKRLRGFKLISKKELL